MHSTSSSSLVSSSSSSSSSPSLAMPSLFPPHYPSSLNMASLAQLSGLLHPPSQHHTHSSSPLGLPSLQTMQTLQSSMSFFPQFQNPTPATTSPFNTAGLHLNPHQLQMPSPSQPLAALAAAAAVPLSSSISSSTSSSFANATPSLSLAQHQASAVSPLGLGTSNPSSSVASSSSPASNAGSIGIMASTAATATATANPGSSSGSGSTAYAPVRSGRTKDKLKHSKSETRRRTRLRVQFECLRDTAKCGKKDRFNILQCAIERIQAYEKRIGLLEAASHVHATPGGNTGNTDMNVDEGGNHSSLSSLRVSHLALLAPVAACLISANGSVIDSNSAFQFLFGFGPSSASLTAASASSSSSRLTSSPTAIKTDSTMSTDLTPQPAPSRRVDTEERRKDRDDKDGESDPSHENSDDESSVSSEGSTSSRGGSNIKNNPDAVPNSSRLGVGIASATVTNTPASTTPSSTVSTLTSPSSTASTLTTSTSSTLSSGAASVSTPSPSSSAAGSSSVSSCSIFTLTHPSCLLSLLSCMQQLLSGSVHSYDTEAKCVDANGNVIQTHMTMWATHRGNLSGTLDPDSHKTFVAIFIPKTNLDPSNSNPTADSMQLSNAAALTSSSNAGISPISRIRRTSSLESTGASASSATLPEPSGTVSSLSSPPALAPVSSSSSSSSSSTASGLSSTTGLPLNLLFPSSSSPSPVPASSVSKSGALTRPIAVSPTTIDSH